MLNEQRNPSAIDRNLPPNYIDTRTLANVKVAALQINIASENEEAHLPWFLGSTLRGGLAMGMKRTVCALRTETCKACILRERCAYSYLFETQRPVNAEILRSVDSIPRPIIIEPPPGRDSPFQKGDELIFSVTLIGKATEYVPFIIAAADTMVKTGLGKQRHPFVLKKVEARAANPSKILWPAKGGIPPVQATPIIKEEASSSSDAPTEITLRFITPTRILTDGTLERPLSFRTLTRALLSRVTSMAAFHCDTAVEVDARGLLQAAEKVTAAAHSLVPSDVRRWSNRQNQRIDMYGFTGEVTYTGAHIHEVMPLIRLGEVLHVGKGTVFGMGRFEVVEPANNKEVERDR